jgi:hypothetical protein
MVNATETDDLVKRLRTAAQQARISQFGAPAFLCEEAAAEIERLRALLKPFADYAIKLDYTMADYPDLCPLGLCPDRINQSAPTVGDLRRAAAALAPPSERVHDEVPWAPPETSPFIGWSFGTASSGQVPVPTTSPPRE